MTSKNDYLRNTGESILLAYNELLVMLGGNQAGDHRLQNGLAAAVAGLSAREFSSLPGDMKESHRRNFVRSPIHQQLAPGLIIYLGSPLPNEDKPATIEQIRSTDELIKSDNYPWDLIWKDGDTSPTALGWTARSLTPQSHFAYLCCMAYYPLVTRDTTRSC